MYVYEPIYMTPQLPSPVGSAPAFKGNVRRRSDWFIARYAQTTPMTNVATSDQPILDLRWAQIIPPA